MNTADSTYRNYDHYIRDGWLAQPKVSAKRLGDLMVSLHAQPVGSLLDVGCATGELLNYLGARFPELQLTGVDVFDELLVIGRHLLPRAEFVKASALDLPSAWIGRFDQVTAIGVMSIFDNEQLVAFWRNLLAATRPGGWVTVLSPLNEFGVDALIRHRKRRDGEVLAWETGWNIFAMETVRDCLAELGQSEWRFDRFVFDQVLAPRVDPIRTWTMPTSANPHQLTNGLKLLVDHYFVSVRKQ